jgi:putative transposase
MMKNKYMAKDFQDQALYEFGRQLEYKSNFKGIPFIKADKFFASSKTCSRCGEIKKNLKPQQKTFRCECGNVIDVHKQAALNLKTYGEANLAE